MIRQQPRSPLFPYPPLFRSTAETLQRALLPPTLPELPAHDLAARYLPGRVGDHIGGDWDDGLTRSEEHTAELQSRQYLVYRLFLENKNGNSRGQTVEEDVTL